MATPDLGWCSIYGYDIPEDHECLVGICYNSELSKFLPQSTDGHEILYPEEQE
jgi:hypothetical protein